MDINTVIIILTHLANGKKSCFILQQNHWAETATLFPGVVASFMTKVFIS